MAITLVGTASNFANDGGDVTVTLPGGTAEGDVVYAAYSDANSTNLDMSMVTSGYTELADLMANDSSDVNTGVFRKVMGSTPDTTAVFNGGGAVDTAVAAVVMVLRGVNITTPEDATTTTATGINGPTPNPPSITTVTAGAWVLAVGGSSEADAPGAPTNYSDLVSQQHTDVAATNIMMARREIASPGAEDPGTFSGIVGTTADCWCAATIAVRPIVAAVATRSGMLLRGVGP